MTARPCSRAPLTQASAQSSPSASANNPPRCIRLSTSAANSMASPECPVSTPAPASIPTPHPGRPSGPRPARHPSGRARSHRLWRDRPRLLPRRRAAPRPAQEPHRPARNRRRPQAPHPLPHQLRSRSPDLIWSPLSERFKPDVLALPLHGCVNVHASLLPRWRGAAPIKPRFWLAISNRCDNHENGSRRGYGRDHQSTRKEN